MQKHLSLLFLVCLAPSLSAQGVSDQVETAQAAAPEHWGFAASTPPKNPPEFLISSYHIRKVPAAVPSGWVLQDSTGNVLTPPMGLEDWCIGAEEGSIDFQDLLGKRTLFNVHQDSEEKQVLFDWQPGSTPVPTLPRQEVNCKDFYGEPVPFYVETIQRNRYKTARGPYGDGVQSFQLVPYRTVAASKAGLPLGTVVYLKRFAGRTFVVKENKTITHDGYFLVADRGGLEPHQLDVFSGYSRYLPSAIQELERGWVVNDSEIRWRLYQLHCPQAQRRPATEDGWQSCSRQP